MLPKPILHRKNNVAISFKQFLAKASLTEDMANDHKTDPPVLLTLRRKTVRNFPDGQKVALYYIKAIDKYISIPFDQRNQPQGLPSLSTEGFLGESTAPNTDFNQNPETHPGYAYHVTSRDNAHDIADHGHMVPHKPSYGTDQSSWPDGSTKKRSYFAPKPSMHFAPDHNPVVLRTPHEDHIKPEKGTGDLYTHEKIPSHKLEYHGVDNGWHPLTHLKTTNESFQGTKVLEEAKKKPAAKPKPYDFMKHLKDISKMGDDRKKPLRFVSGQKHHEDPETAQMVLDFHKACKPINQATMHKMMTRSKEGYHKVRMTAIGWAARPTVKKS